MLTGCDKFGISLAMSTPRYTTDIDHWIHHSSGGTFSSEHHRILALHLSIMRLRQRRRPRSGDWT